MIKSICDIHKNITIKTETLNLYKIILEKRKFMKYLLIEYPKCSTCKNAEKFLKENGINFESRNIVTETPTIEELKIWIEKSKLPIKKFFNTSGLLYKSMNLKEEIKKLTDDEKIAMLASNGMLIKRPILIEIETGNVLLGFKQEEWKKIKK